MTDPVVRLETTQLTVEPGGQAVAVVTVLNPGTIVESYALDVVGEQPIPWAEVTPPVLSVYPQQQETATVVFSPPAGPTGPGGLVPFGIRAKSQVDPSASAVAEGELEIGQVFGLQAKLTPVTSSGRWRGLHTIQFSNWGNAPARLRIVASDPDQALGFLVRPEVVDVPLGASATARIKVRTRKPVLRGSTNRLPFKVTGEPDPPPPVGAPVTPGADPGRPVVDGAFTQKPILTRAVVTAAAVVGAALIGVLVFALTRGGPETKPIGDGVTVPAKPTLTAAAAGPATISLAWEPLTNVDSYKLQFLDPVSGRTNKAEGGIDVKQNAKNVDKLNPATKYCFTLLAVNGELSGPESEIACATTAKAAPTPTAGPSGPTSGPPTGDPTQGGPTQGGPTTGGPSSPPPTTAGPSQSSGPTTGTGPENPAFPLGQFISAIRLWPAGSPAAEQTARDLAAQLASAGVPAKVLNVAGQYPGMTMGTPRQPMRDVWGVYVGPAASPGEVDAICKSEAVRKVVATPDCVSFEPAKAPAG